MNERSVDKCLLSGVINCDLFQKFKLAAIRNGLYNYEALEHIMQEASKSNFSILKKIKKYRGLDKKE